MKNLIKGIISYTALVGVPIIAIGSISAAAYKVGHSDGMQEGLATATNMIKASIERIEEKNEE